MASFRSDADWWPRSTYPGGPHLVFVATSTASGVRLASRPDADSRAVEFIGRFFRARVGTMADAELSCEVNFLYVVLRRSPLPSDGEGEVGHDSPVAEFGYGGPPASPEEWPGVELRALLFEAIQQLAPPGPAP